MGQNLILNAYAATRIANVAMSITNQTQRRSWLHRCSIQPNVSDIKPS
jgi:hypothetical protein